MIISGLASALIAGGLSEIAEVVIDKGEDYVKDKIKEITGIDIGNNPSKSDIERVKIKEDKLLEILTEKNRHSERVMESALNKEKAYLNDVANARDLNKSYIESDDKFVSRFLPVVTVIILVGGGIFLYALTFSNIPEPNRVLAINAQNLIGYMLTAVMSFYFGHQLRK